MYARRQRRTVLVRAFASILAIATLSVGALPAQAGTGDDNRAVAQWAQHAARPLTTIDPAAPLTDLGHLRRAIADAKIVGLGEAVHGAAEITALKHRVLRLLVEGLGYRTIAWEEDWSLGLRINQYLRTGEGDLAGLVGAMSTAWRSTDVADVLRWIRAWNVRHHDDVTFVGVEGYGTRPAVYQLVEAYVAERAPDRLAQVRTHLRPLTPKSDDMRVHAQWYAQQVRDKAPYVRHARDLYRLVTSVPHEPGDRRHELHLQHARQIVGFYEQFADSNPLAYRDAHAAKNLRWTQQFFGDKVAYWAASGHTVDGAALQLTYAQYLASKFASVGSFIRDWYGRRYLSIGFTLDRGSAAPDGQAVALPPAAPDWLEAPFRAVRADQFSLDLRGRVPGPVHTWLDAPTRTRGVPEDGLASYLSGGTPRQWFDVVVHRHVVTPVSAG
ncbi:erythromycin esterase family protein [Cryptosporangium aurantiacum]|uniref:Erythromycin esterase n=1 Tax=Cryptosporangium aurantiacum TaxID=134849 RepID=A0A1M7R3L5_9ACTN|nr:erythromycin esterase family protein [Cryptosporangium aurantiacum]SHN39294.1 erythromycin esterase [Cryptosporangium aurantiacum]